MGTTTASLLFDLQKRDWESITSESMSTSLLLTNATIPQSGSRIDNFSNNASILTVDQHIIFSTGSNAASGGTVDFLSLTGYYNFTSASPDDILGVDTRITTASDIRITTASDIRILA